jgi:hypothetical protein
MDDPLYMLVYCVGMACTPLTADFTLTRARCVEEMQRSPLPNVMCRSRHHEFGMPGQSRFGPQETPLPR